MDRKSAVFVGIALELPALIVTFVYLGKYCDDRWNLKDMGTAAGAFLGLVAWVVHVVILFKETDEK